MEIIRKIQEMQQEMTRWRQKLHAEPELAFEERATARFLTRQLQSFGIEVHALTKTGVIGVLHGKEGPATDTGGRTIMLRADMDASAIEEKSGVVHTSRTEGVHHADGHDGHMAMLLGAAKYLAQTRNFNGTVYFVFQPAEESLDGASEMIKDGLFSKFPCDEVYALHNVPELPLGTLASSTGPIMAASDEFHVILTGTGGHIAHPENTSNLSGAVAEVITAMNAMLKKEIPAGDPAVMTISSIVTDSQTAYDISDTVWLSGSVRGYDTALHEKLKKNLEQIIKDTADKYGATVTLQFKNSYAPVVNSAAETNLALEAAKDIVGEDKVLPAPQTLQADDFARYLQKKPGNLMEIGTGRANGKTAPAHSAKYDFNDAALPIGASYWVKLVEKALPMFGRAPAPAVPKAPQP